MKKKTIEIPLQCYIQRFASQTGHFLCSVSIHLWLMLHTNMDIYRTKNHFIVPFHNVKTEIGMRISKQKR